MTPNEILKEILYPLTHAAVLMTMVLLYAVMTFVAYGGVLGLILLFLVLPALFRYLMVVLSWRARGLETPTLDVDHLSWFGNAWSIFPALLAVLITVTFYYVSANLGPIWTYALAVVVVATLPASLAVLAISRSPFQSINPGAIATVISRCGGDYWVAPTFIVVAVFIEVWMTRSGVHTAIRNFAGMYFLFALFALIGGIIRKERLVEEADIPDPELPGEEEIQADLAKERQNILGHAYGFISRGNRAGGFKHIEDWLQRDPDPRSAWDWFFQQMMRWENKDPALVFAQSYVGQLLRDGDKVAAVKVMMRCRMENERFVPLDGDMQLAIAAAEACGDQDLASFLQSRV